jgi:hypothetical protein
MEGDLRDVFRGGATETLRVAPQLLRSWAEPCVRAPQHHNNTAQQYSSRYYICAREQRGVVSRDYFHVNTMATTRLWATNVRDEKAINRPCQPPKSHLKSPDECSTPESLFGGKDGLGHGPTRSSATSWFVSDSVSPLASRLSSILSRFTSARSRIPSRSHLASSHSLIVHLGTRVFLFFSWSVYLI